MAPLMLWHLTICLYYKPPYYRCQEHGHTGTASCSKGEGPGLLACAHPIDRDQQVLRAAQEGTGTVGWGVHDQARLLQPPHEFRQSDLGLHACQRRSKANMDATAKPQVLIIAPLGIKTIRVREPRRVTVARGQSQRDQHALGNRRPSQGNLVQGGPTYQELDRRLIAQQFL